LKGGNCGMKKKPLFWHLFPAFLLLVIVCLAAVAWYASTSFRNLHYCRTTTSLEAVARLAALHVQAESPELNPAVVQSLCRDIGRTGGARLTVVTPSGTVIADTDHDPASMDNHADRPEIIQAWKQGQGFRTRRSGTLQEDMMYVAIPLRSSGDRDLAVVRAALALDDINKTVRQLTEKVILFGIMVAVLGAVLTMLLTRRVTWPLNQIRHSASDFAAGRLEHRLPSSDVSEVDVLTSALNHMSEELSSRIETITQQRDEENALLSCMTEAVLAVDTDRHLLKMNDSARALLQVDAMTPGKTPIAEVIRNADLLAIIDRTLASDEPVEGDILIPERERYLQAHGTALTGSDGQHVGAVIAINDVTRLRRLATMRRDFVANVSHELKTPITAIKGFAETLLEETPVEETDRQHFLDIISKQSDRLQSIVEDLLILSDIENATEGDTIEFVQSSLLRIIEGAVASCEPAAKARGIAIAVECDAQLEAQINLQLLEQAVSNLVGNAVKYGVENTTVHIGAQVVDGEVAIAVRDEGPGIASKHLPRLFERFYRVDKSRSRKLGGTGLGLAIVKRIALAHGGRVHVESELGEGSTFTIFLPKS